MKLQKNTADLLPKLKAMALADRAVFEKGMKAFVSYIQAYAKHECNLIFRLKGKLDLLTIWNIWWFLQVLQIWRASQVALVVKNLPANAGDIRDMGWIPRLGRSPGGGNDNLLQYSYLENHMDRGAWQATVHGVTELDTS